MFFCITGTWLLVIAAIVAAAVIVVKAHLRKSEDRSHDAVSDKARPYMMSSLVEELRPRALSYAIYVLCIERQKKAAIKKQLYKQYGKENMLPKLEECSLFAKNPELMSDRAFLNDVNDWILKNGGVPAPSFFVASNTVGMLIYKTLVDEAEKIVDGAH